MRLRPHGRTLVLLVGTIIAFQWSLTAQTPSPSAKRPITYDVMDYWRSIGGTRLSNDGQWLAYALTSQGDDGDLVVRNLRSGQEFRSPRGTGPDFTADGKYVVFTIAQTKAEEEKEREQTREPEPGGRCGRPGRPREQPGRAHAADRHGDHVAPGRQGHDLREGRQLPRAGRVIDVGRVLQGCGRHRRRRTGRTRRPRWTSGHAARGSRRRVNAEAAPQNAAREKRKDPGSDLILRNLTTGDETTIPEVTRIRVRHEGRTPGVRRPRRRTRPRTARSSARQPTA